ncbi:putative protein [Nocardiopsis dassonvillei]
MVHHGDTGLAGVWAARARPGDEICLAGPGGGYAPDPEAERHLLVGDESALPAIAAALEHLAADAVADVFVELAGPEEDYPLDTAATAHITRLYRGGSPVGEPLVRAVEEYGLPAGDVQAFVHGEAGFVRRVRRLLTEWGLPRARLSASGYWRVGLDEDGWQEAKRRDREAERGGERSTAPGRGR